MCYKVSNGSGSFGLIAGARVRKMDCRQSSEPGLNTIKDCPIATGKNTPKVSDFPLSIS